VLFWVCRSRALCWWHARGVNERFYGQMRVDIRHILGGGIEPPVAAFPLYEALGEVMGEGEEGGEEGVVCRSYYSRYVRRRRHHSRRGEEKEGVGLLRGAGGEMTTFRVTEERREVGREGGKEGEEEGEEGDEEEAVPLYRKQM